MILTPQEKAICKEYSARDLKGKVHCSECPLAVDARYALCKRNLSKKEWEEEYSYCRERSN